MKAGWQSKSLAEILLKTETVNPNLQPESDFEYIDVSSVSNQTFQIGETQSLKGKDAPSRARKLVKTNDILFATIRPTLQRIAIVPSKLNNQVCSTGYFVLRPNESIHYKYLYYYLFADGFMGQMEALQKGASYPAVTDNEVKSQSISFPLIPEQQRIVAILDQAFEGIAKARANAEQNLQNARALFESHLQSVFTQRSDGWVENTLDNVCDLITCGVAATPKYVDEAVGVPFLSAQNVRDGEVVLDKYRHISKEFHRELTKKNKPARGDVLYSRVGSKFGEAGVVEHDFEFSVYVSLTLIKPKPEILNSYFLKHYLNSAIVKSIAIKSISSSGVPNLNVKDVRQFPIRLPSITQQLKLIEEINVLRVETQRLEALYQRKIACLDELKKSLLQQAFAGEL